MRAYASTLQLVGAKLPARAPRSSLRSGLVEINPRTVPFGAVGRLSGKLGIEPRLLLDMIRIPARTALRRHAAGFLNTEEADRLLRVARVVEEAIRIFGSEEKTSRWLKTSHPLLGDTTPLSLLDSDAGARLVEEELVRIDYGDFA